jgi:hypothetical protein
MLVDVAGEQDAVDALVDGDADDLVEGRRELVRPRPASDRSPDVPIARVQEPQC